MRRKEEDRARGQVAVRIVSRDGHCGDYVKVANLL